MTWRAGTGGASIGKEEKGRVFGGTVSNVSRGRTKRKVLNSFITLIMTGAGRSPPPVGGKEVKSLKAHEEGQSGEK